MNIGIDFEKLRNRNSGLGMFAHNLAQELAVINSDPLTYYIPQEENGKYGNSINYVNWKRYHQFLGIPLECDVWHSIHQEAKYFPRKSGKKLLTIHDLNFLQKYTGAKKKSALVGLQRNVNRADGIAFISKYTQNIANQHLNFGNKPQKIVYNGITIDETVGVKKPDGSFERPFIFSIGIINEKKNFHVLLNAMKHLEDYDLYFAGDDSSVYAKKLADSIENSKLQKQVKMLGQVSEAEKNWLYQNCSAFVFPSLAEGFGLPVIEALYYGKPTITSNLTALPEIGGGYTHLLKSFESVYIAQTIADAISEHTVQKAKELSLYAGSFSWKNAAASYMEFYHELAMI